MINSVLAKIFAFFSQILVRLQPIWDKYKAVVGLILGILIGWFILGWGIFPVKWVDATPGHLREDFRSAYLAYAGEDYLNTGDLSLLRSRLGLDLPKSRNIPWLANRERLEEDIEVAIEKSDNYRLSNHRQALTSLKQIINQRAEVLYGEALAGEEAPQPTAEKTTIARVLRIVGIVLVILLVGAAIFAIWSLLAGRGKRKRAVADVQGADTGEGMKYGVVGTGKSPVKSFNTPYMLGDDYFDPSFSIEIGNDFLGECGIGISETLGAGDPKKVTAFEAWLFDKSDIRTVTTVLASDYAFNDPSLRAKLEPKGDIVELAPGEEIVLETSSLRVKARIEELDYAQGSGLPDRSFVQKVNFELQAWVKQADEPEYLDYEDYEAV